MAYEILNNPVFDLSEDENGNTILLDVNFEIKDTNNNKVYRAVAYSLQDGTDTIRLSFDMLNEDDEFEEIGYGYYDDSFNIVAEDAGNDIEDTELQDFVIDTVNTGIDEFRGH